MVQLSPTSLSFGSVKVGTKSRWQEGDPDQQRYDISLDYFDHNYRYQPRRLQSDQYLWHRNWRGSKLYDLGLFQTDRDRRKKCHIECHR